MTRHDNAPGGTNPGGATSTSNFDAGHDTDLRSVARTPDGRGVERDRGVLDSAAAIRGVLTAEAEVLEAWRRRQPALLAALRDLQPGAELEAVRTLAAAARVERRRRAAAGGLAELLGTAGR